MRITIDSRPETMNFSRQEIQPLTRRQSSSNSKFETIDFNDDDNDNDKNNDRAYIVKEIANEELSTESSTYTQNISSSFEAASGDTYENKYNDSTDCHMVSNLDPRMSIVRHWNVEDGPITLRRQTNDLANNDGSFSDSSSSSGGIYNDHIPYHYSNEESPLFIRHVNRPLSPSNSFPPGSSTASHPLPLPGSPLIYNHVLKPHPQYVPIPLNRSDGTMQRGHQLPQSFKKLKHASSSRKPTLYQILFIFSYLWLLMTIVIYHFFYTSAATNTPSSHPISVLPPPPSPQSSLRRRRGEEQKRQQQHQQRPPPSQKRHPTLSRNTFGVVQETSYTVRVSARRHLAPTFRPDLIFTAVRNYTACKNVREVQVAGRDLPDGLPTGVREMSEERGRKKDSVESKAVVLVDDDLLLSCQDLDRAFHLWSHNPQRLVGFFGYHHRPRLTPSPQGQPYTLVTTRAAVLHRAYLPYHNTLCSSLTLSVRVTGMTQLPPLRVYGTPVELRSSDVGRRVREEAERREMEVAGECLRGLIVEYVDWGEGDLPEEEVTYFGM